MIFYTYCIDFQALPVARMSVTASVKGEFRAAITLNEAVTLALNHLTLEIDTTNGKSKVRASTSNNFNRLRIAPSVTVKASASIEGSFFFCYQQFTLQYLYKSQFRQYRG